MQSQILSSTLGVAWEYRPNLYYKGYLRGSDIPTADLSRLWTWFEWDNRQKWVRLPQKWGRHADEKLHKLSREKTFANWWEIRFLTICAEKTFADYSFCLAKGCHAPNFAEKTFVYSHNTVKFAKVFSELTWLWPCVENCGCTSRVVSCGQTLTWPRETTSRARRIFAWDRHQSVCERETFFQSVRLPQIAWDLTGLQQDTWVTKQPQTRHPPNQSACPM